MQPENKQLVALLKNHEERIQLLQTQVEILTQFIETIVAATKNESECSHGALLPYETCNVDGTHTFNKPKGATTHDATNTSTTNRR